MLGWATMWIGFAKASASPAGHHGTRGRRGDEREQQTRDIYVNPVDLDTVLAQLSGKTTTGISHQ